MSLLLIVALSGVTILRFMTRLERRLLHRQ